MQLIIAHSVLNIHGIDLKDSHVLVLQGRLEDRTIASLPRLYSPEKAYLSSKDVPYTTEKLRCMEFSDRDRRRLDNYQRADFGRIYDEASDTYTPLPGGWMEFDENGCIVDSSSDPFDIFTRLSGNSATYHEATVLIPPHVGGYLLTASQLLHQYMNIQAPVFFVTYHDEDDRFAAAFLRRHETPWTKGSVADLNARRLECMLLANHWFRENSYVVFSRLLMEASGYPDREFSALSPLDLQILFYLSREKHISLDSLVEQINFTNDDANSLADNLPADFSLHNAIHELAQLGFMQKHVGSPYWILSDTGRMLLIDLFDTNRKAKHLTNVLRERKALGLVALDTDGVVHNTDFGNEYARQLAYIKNTTGFVSVMSAFKTAMAIKSARLLSVQDVEYVFHQKKSGARSDVEYGIKYFVEVGLVKNNQESGLYSLSSNGLAFVGMLHPRTLDPAAFGRMNRWIKELDYTAIKRYINTIFGRQLQYSQRALGNAGRAKLTT